MMPECNPNLILVDKKQVLHLLNEHRFKDLREIFEGNGCICYNCNHYNRTFPICRRLRANYFCTNWESIQEGEENDK